MSGTKRYGLMIFLCLLLSACESGANYAPVTEVSTIDPIPASGAIHVGEDESVYEIAWRYGLDYRVVAKNNHLSPPYRVHAGQVIYLRAPKQLVSAQGKVEAPIKAVPKPQSSPTFSALPVEREPTFSISKWLWPATGKVIKTFSATNRGVNIAGVTGEPVYAAAPGKVVYCGDGLRGYGNLIIIKHNNLYLSAYAHNKEVLVKEGDWVKQGQQIAQIGKSGTTKTMLHFEIRRAGKPVDPMPLLNA